MRCFERYRVHLNRLSLSNAVMRMVSGYAPSVVGAMGWSIFSSGPAAPNLQVAALTQPQWLTTYARLSLVRSASHSLFLASWPSESPGCSVALHSVSLPASSAALSLCLEPASWAKR